MVRRTRGGAKTLRSRGRWLLALLGGRSHEARALKTRMVAGTPRGSERARSLRHKSSSLTADAGRSAARDQECQFVSTESKVRLTSCSLRRRVPNRVACFRNLYLQLVLCALAFLCLVAPTTVSCEALGNEVEAPHPEANATLPVSLPEIMRIPDQDCVFPYFKEYTGACVSHRYVNGQSLYYHVPKFVTGYVVLIHGAGVGRSEDWFVRINRIPMMKRLINDGFAVAAVQSVAQWTMLTRQRDLTNQDQAFWQIVRETGMSPDVPVFAVCVSRGCQYQGWMAETLWRQRRPLRAQYMSIPWGVTRQFLARSAQRMPPTIVAIGEADTVPMVNTRAQLQPWVDAMRANGVEANLYVNKARNVDDCFHTLCRMPHTGGREMTRELVQEMRSQGVIDEEGRIIIPLPAMQGVENPYERLIVDAYMGVNYLRDWPVFSFAGPMIDWIYQELSELQGGHRHTSDFDTAVLNTFLRHSKYGEISAMAARG